jgi:hypothetical protein
MNFFISGTAGQAALLLYSCSLCCGLRPLRSCLACLLPAAFRPALERRASRLARQAIVARPLENLKTKKPTES